MKKFVYVVVDHLEVEPNNWSSEVVKVFASGEKAEEFAAALRKHAEPNESVEIETMEFVE